MKKLLLLLTLASISAAHGMGTQTARIAKKRLLGLPIPGTYRVPGETSPSLMWRKLGEYSQPIRKDFETATAPLRARMKPYVHRVTQPVERWSAPIRHDWHEYAVPRIRGYHHARTVPFYRAVRDEVVLPKFRTIRDNLKLLGQDYARDFRHAYKVNPQRTVATAGAHAGLVGLWTAGVATTPTAVRKVRHDIIKPSVQRIKLASKINRDEEELALLEHRLHLGAH